MSDEVSFLAEAGKHAPTPILLIILIWAVFSASSVIKEEGKASREEANKTRALLVQLEEATHEEANKTRELLIRLEAAISTLPTRLENVILQNSDKK